MISLVYSSNTHIYCQYCTCNHSISTASCRHMYTCAHMLYKALGILGYWCLVVKLKTTFFLMGNILCSTVHSLAYWYIVCLPPTNLLLLLFMLHVWSYCSVCSSSAVVIGASECCCTFATMFVCLLASGSTGCRSTALLLLSWSSNCERSTCWQSWSAYQ